MRHIVDPLQGRLFDPFQQIIPPLGLKSIANGWQSIFRAGLLPLMPVGKLGGRLHPFLGRPSKELYSVAGLLFLQEAKGWTNDDAVQAYLFHTDVQFALNLEPGFDQISLCTFERYRALFRDNDLAAQLMNDITMKLVDELDLHIDQQRRDSRPGPRRRWFSLWLLVETKGRRRNRVLWKADRERDGADRRVCLRA